MKKSQRALIISKILDKEYPATPIPLDHFSTYSLLIAVLLSAQCTDERVNKVTPKLFDIASDPISMSKLSQNAIYEIIKPCGLGPKKSKAILNLSKILVKNFNSKVPQDFKDLEIIINGGVTSVEEVKDHLDKVDGAMIGRSVYHSPYLLADIEKEIFNNRDIKEREEIVEELSLIHI